MLVLLKLLDALKVKLLILRDISYMIIETIKCLLLGGLPIIWVYLEHDVEEVVQTLKSLMTSDYLLVFFAVYAAIYGLIWLFGYLFNINNPGVRNWLAGAIDVFSDVGSGFHGVYRVATGILLSIPVLWFFDERDFGALARQGSMLYLGALFLVFSFCLKSAHEFMARNNRHRLS